MKSLNKNTIKDAIPSGKQRSYHEIVEFLDANWTTNNTDKNLTCIKQLDKAFGNLSQKLHTILIGGTNGKSLTVNFTAKLLADEGLKVGAFYSPHLLTYNERLSINNETISNKTFTEIGNEVLNAAEALNLTPSSYDVLTMMALVFFSTHETDVALLEVSEGGQHNTTAICSPKIAAITRITFENAQLSEEVTRAHIKEMLGIVKKDTHVISADQSKLHLQAMLEIVKDKGGTWGMPIRKLAPLGYPFEQLHGRCAALAERIAYVYINNFANKDAVVVTGTLLTKQKGQRGRPTLEAKRQSEMNPRKTMEQFWKDVSTELPGRFQLLDKEKPTLLLDNAHNIDAFKNLLLGIRLLHYQRPLKGLTLVIGCNNNELDLNEFLKQLRYFFKKTTGSVILCPVATTPGQKGVTSWDVEKVTNDTKSMKIKAKATKSFKEAFELAAKSVDDRQGLVVITGSPAIISEYWRYKGVKKI
jgi:dihydrofolate synthase/folylpolyglutamate synthase